MQQVELLKKDIQIAIGKTHVAITNGISLKSNLDLLNAEMLKSNQRIIELKNIQNGFVQMLAFFINQTINENTFFEYPAAPIINDSINRPEIQLFELQKRAIESQKRVLNTKILPKFSLFFQGGIGRPALNMLSSEAETYYIGGIRLAWNFSNFYTFSREKQVMSINQKMIDTQKDVFSFNTNLQLKQQHAELVKYQQLIATDNEVIRLRENVKTIAKSQLENGTVSINDFLLYLNAEDQAKHNKLLHEIQLLVAQFQYQIISGN